MNQDDRAAALARPYLVRLRRALGDLPAAEVDDIVLEIEGHIAERSAGSADPEAGVAEALDALGDPEELAARYKTEAVLARGRSGGTALTLLRAVHGWAMEGFVGLVIFLVGISGYSLAAGLVALAVLKPVFPQHVGLWRNPPDLFALGFVSGPPDPRFEILGWWIMPLGLVLGCLLWLVTTRLLGVAMRRLRGFSSPLPPAGKR